MDRWRMHVASHLAQPQHRNTYYLTANTLTGAAAGLVFWLVLARIAGLPPADIGLGYAIIALGTTVGVLAKGGLDTALLRSVPLASSQDGARLLRFGGMVGGSVALLLALGLGVVSGLGHGPHVLSPTAWALVAAIGVLLVITWLQDAYHLAEGSARPGFMRTIVFSAARLLLPLPLLALAVPHPVALTWALALFASALAALGFHAHRVTRAGRTVPRREFLLRAGRNVTGGAAEFLPGLILVPLVLALDGPAAAAYFGIAWTGASVLFLACAAVSRSALAELVRNPDKPAGRAIGRGVLQHLWLVAPATLVALLLAPHLLSVFGPAYAREGALAFTILAASTLFVAPAYLYLAVLRARDRPLGLIVFPAAMIAALLVLAPLLEGSNGLAGVALAWLLANAPFGIYAAWRLRREAREVTTHGPPHHSGHPHLE